MQESITQRRPGQIQVLYQSRRTFRLEIHSWSIYSNCGINHASNTYYKHDKSSSYYKTRRTASHVRYIKTHCRPTYYWPHITNDVYATIAKCKSCVRNGNKYHRKQPLQPFSASESLNFKEIDKLELLQNYKARQSIHVHHGEMAFQANMGYRHVQYNIYTNGKHLRPSTNRSFCRPHVFLTSNGPQFLYKFFALVCGY